MLFFRLTSSSSSIISGRPGASRSLETSEASVASTTFKRAHAPFAAEDVTHRCTLSPGSKVSSSVLMSTVRVDAGRIKAKTS